ncbi:unnamed protein product [Strongylus vulgaris]|uniref:Uncharacterized protein n=1 Tax=Strongylus vulgaris TaxID=40348 RepID=A0A3P7IXH1_STRVU|nr:unnamed protein product [Strongylus vulgaris]
MLRATGAALAEEKVGGDTALTTGNEDKAQKVITASAGEAGIIGTEDAATIARATDETLVTAEKAVDSKPVGAALGETEGSGEDGTLTGAVAMEKTEDAVKTVRTSGLEAPTAAGGDVGLLTKETQVGSGLAGPEGPVGAVLAGGAPPAAPDVASPAYPTLPVASAARLRRYFSRRFYV